MFLCPFQLFSSSSTLSFLSLTFLPISQLTVGLLSLCLFFPFLSLSLTSCNQFEPCTASFSILLQTLLFMFIFSCFIFMFFRTLQTVGPSHARTYTVAVYFKGERIGCGKGPRYKYPHANSACVYVCMCIFTFLL